MYSPKRTERNDTSSLGALTPIVHVLKNAQSNASRDFDRFYDNLWSKLTPSNSRTRKRTPDRMSQHKRDDYNGTSLTPLIERHSLREDARYEYLDPSYKDNESDIADTPGLERAETPMSYDSPIRHSPKKSIAPSMMHSSPQRSTLDSPQRSMLNSPQRSMLHSPQRSMLHSHQRSMIHSPRRSMIDTSLMNHRLAEERKRMDMLQSKVTKIRRQSSFLAEEPSFTLEKDDSMPTIELNRHHQYRLSLHQLATPPQSIDYNKIRNQMPVSSNHSLVSKRHRSPSTESPQTKRMAVSLTPNKCMAVSPKPITRAAVTPTPRTRMAVSPQRIALDDLPKLRSTEMISTPGGSIVSNRFWKEIHGLNSTKSPITQRATRTIESSQTWANDEDFWSAESAPIASTFNKKLFKVAQQEEIQKKKQKEQIENDMQWSIETPVSSKLNMFGLDSFSEKLLNLAGSPSSLSQELESARKRDEIIKRNNIPVMNPNLLAELKSKHRAKLIDDSDSYKFT